MCPHTPQCPDPKDLDREAARTIISRPEQGWSLLCNGIVVFEDTGELLRPTDLFCRPQWPVREPETAETSQQSPAA